MAIIGKVVAMTGVAFVITGNGSKRELKLGDQVQTSDSIQTPRGVDVDLELVTGRVIHIGSEQLVAFTEELTEAIVPSGLDSAINLATIDTVISAIESGKDINEVLEETAAGPGGVGNSYGFGFVDLLRINDDLNNFKFAYEYNTDNRLESEPAAIIDDASNGSQPGTGVPLTPVNAPPVAAPLAIGNAEGAGSVSGNLVATDANGDTLTYSAIGVLPPGLVLNPDGSFTFDYSDPAYNILAAGVPQVLVVPYLVSDGKGGTSTSALTITVTGTNDAPVAVDDIITVNEDSLNNPSVTSLLANDTDVDGPALTIAAASVGTFATTAGGSITIAANGTYTYTPLAGYVGADSFDYTVTDGSLTNDGTLNITVVPTPTLSIGDVTVVENIAGGFATFTVTLSAVSGQTVTVGYNTSNGTATAGSDYTNSTGTITFLPGEISQTITVPIINDSTDEPNETFYVNLVTPTNATINDNLGVGTILDNDAAPTIASVSAESQFEGTSLVHTVTLSNASSVPTTFSYSLGGGTATSGTDYSVGTTFSHGVTLSSGILTVPAGVTSFTVTVPTVLDTIDEGVSETYNLTVGGQIGVGTIVDDDVSPTLAISNVITSEVAGSFAVFNMTLSAASSTPVTVSLALAGTNTGPSALAATSGADFTNATQISTNGGVTWSANVASATFATGTTSILVRTPILENGPTNEANEDFSLTANVTAGFTANASAVGTATITERNITTVSSPTVTEGGNLDFAVTLPTGAATVYNVNVLGGSASGTDYGVPTITGITGGGTVTLVGNVLTVSATVTGFTIRYATTNDTLDEINETLILNVGGVTGTGTITDNDATPTLSINDVTVNEAAGTMTFTVTLNAASGLPVTVNYNMSSQTALSGSDFTSTSGTLTFAPGVTIQTITVPILNDNVYEGAETFRVDLSTPTNATIADGIGIGTIRDDGAGAGGTDNDTPTLAVSSITVSDQAAGFATFVVSLSNPSAVATTFNLALANGSATGGGVDYGSAGATNIQVSTNNGATWENATSATIPILGTYVLVRTPIIPDVAFEVSETFTLTATRTAGITTNASAVGTATITDIFNGPDAINDVPTSNLQEDTANSVLAGNVIFGGGGNVADTDPNNDTLLITGAIAGAGAVVGTVPLGSALTVSGIYGNLLINANGSFTYTLDNSRIQTQNILGNGIPVNDVFTYRITDGNGGFDTATISIPILGTLDLTAITPQPVAIIADGLIGEYYGYNDTIQAANAGFRIHADDALAITVPYNNPADTGINDQRNINSIEDLEFVINGRNALMGGSNSIVGSNTAALVDTADVKFSVRSLNYGESLNLPNSAANASQSAGQALGAGSVLANFLKTDATTATVQTGTPVATGATGNTLSGYDQTTDSIIRMAGTMYLERGNYDFRVRADDGFRLRVGGETLIEYDGNQGPTTRVFNNVEINDLISGFTSVELLYWDQAGQSILVLEYKDSAAPNVNGAPNAGAGWTSFSLDNLAFFSEANKPVLTDTRIQDVVETAINQQYELRTGSVLDGDGNINTLTGDAGRDYIQGLGGNDILNGFGSADFLDGGDGNDRLDGGVENDVLDGGTGADTMIGGLGDDIYRVDNVGDILTEDSNQGVDTVEFEVGYNFGSYTIATNFENVLVKSAFNVNVTGNVENNRITGGSGDNFISAGDGNDRIIAGAGNDTLTGGNGTDIFEWNLADKPAIGLRNATASNVAQDTITDFSTGTYNNVNGISGGDALDLRDLLVDEASAINRIGNLANFIDIVQVGADTVMRVSFNGGYTGGTYNANVTDQVITLSNVNLFTTYSAGTNDNTVLQGLINNNKLFVD